MNALTRSLKARCTAQHQLDTPLGRVTMARTERGLAGLWFEGQKHHPGALDLPERDDDPLLAEAARQLAAYFAGERSAFDLPLDLQGTPFQQSVWQALTRIPPGRTCSYGALARELGTPSAVRAVGAAVGRNPACVLVPCHRVLGQDGSLTGYAGGVERKRALLSLEARS